MTALASHVAPCLVAAIIWFVRRSRFGQGNETNLTQCDTEVSALRVERVGVVRPFGSIDLNRDPHAITEDVQHFWWKVGFQDHRPAFRASPHRYLDAIDEYANAVQHGRRHGMRDRARQEARGWIRQAEIDPGLLVPAHPANPAAVVLLANVPALTVDRLIERELPRIGQPDPAWSRDIFLSGGFRPALEC